MQIQERWHFPKVIFHWRDRLKFLFYLPIFPLKLKLSWNTALQWQKRQNVIEWFLTVVGNLLELPRIICFTVLWFKLNWQIGDQDKRKWIVCHVSPERLQWISSLLSEMHHATVSPGRNSKLLCCSYIIGSMLYWKQTATSTFSHELANPPYIIKLFTFSLFLRSRSLRLVDALSKRLRMSNKSSRYCYQFNIAFQN